LSSLDVNLVLTVGLAFCEGFQKFAPWLQQKGQKLLWERMQQRRRLVRSMDVTRRARAVHVHKTG